MPNLWLCNIDEVPQSIDPVDASHINQYTRVINSRNLFNMCHGDIALFGQSLDSAFIDYCMKMTGGKILTFSEGCSENVSAFIDAIRCNPDFIKKLHSQYDLSQFTLRPFIQSSKAYMLSQLFGTRWDGASFDLIESGQITRANSKIFIKDLAGSVSVKTVPYLVSSDASELLNCIERFGADHGQLFLKKDGMCGGMGNISGTVAELKKKVSSWYHSGDVLLEPLLPVAATLGAFINVLPEQVEFVGVDEQFFCGYEWGGFKFPYQNEVIVNQVRCLSIKVSECLRRLGLYGPVNLDWLVLGSEYEQTNFQSGEIILGECNFRYTGVHPAISFSQQYYGKESLKTQIVSYAQYPIAQQYNTFASLYDRLLSCSYLGKPILLSDSAEKPRPGVVITRPPENDTCGINFFAQSQSDLDECLCVVAEAVT